MAKKKKNSQKIQAWVEARKRFHLSHAQIQMARELGMNPKKFGSLANHKQQPWKEPLPQFIESIYFKRFGKHQPDTVRPVEKRKPARRRKPQQADPENPQTESQECPPPPPF